MMRLIAPYLNHPLRRLQQTFVVSAEPSRQTQPRECPFHHPSLRQHPEPVWLLLQPVAPKLPVSVVGYLDPPCLLPRGFPSWHVVPADEQDRAQVEELAEAVQEATGESVGLAYAGKGYTKEEPAEAEEEHGIRLEVVKRSEAKRGFVLLTRS